MGRGSYIGGCTIITPWRSSKIKKKKKVVKVKAQENSEARKRKIAAKEKRRKKTDEYFLSQNYIVKVPKGLQHIPNATPLLCSHCKKTWQGFNIRNNKPYTKCCFKRIINGQPAAIPRKQGGAS